MKTVVGRASAAVTTPDYRRTSDWDFTPLFPARMTGREGCARNATSAKETGIPSRYEPPGVDTRRREAAALLGPKNVGAGIANVGAGIPREAENVSQLCLKEDLDSHGQFVSQLNQQDAYGFLVARVCP